MVSETRHALNSAVLAIVLCLSVAVSGCSKEPPAPMVPETRYVVVDRPAQIPPGVVRYCWEEPIVELERNGPGLDLEGNWYHPFYIAVREVRQGRWRPCHPMKSEIDGETRNER